jgi:hypothetical protein
MSSLPFPHLCSSLRMFIQQTLPDDCPTRLTNPLWMLCGMFLSRSVLAAVRLYRRRMWIEEMFADWKKHGFDLESSPLRSAQRLGRLT